MICMYTIVVLCVLQLTVADDTSAVNTNGGTSDESPKNQQPDEKRDAASNDSDRIEGTLDASFRNILTYRSIFAAKRKEQIDTAHRILNMFDYAKQYKMVDMLMETIFPAMNDSWAKANESSYIAGASPYPTNEHMQGVVGVVFEGVPFFGDILLRLPKITKDIYYRQRNSLEPILLWGLQFCRNTTTIFNGKHATQLYLIEQELGLVPEDPDYVNPYRESENAEQRSSKKQKSKDKKKSKKGPKLRRRQEL